MLGKLKLAVAAPFIEADGCINLLQTTEGMLVLPLLVLAAMLSINAVAEATCTFTADKEDR